MSRGGGTWRPRVVVVGTGFGRVYLSALRRAGMPFELVGIVARGSARSRACAGAYEVPLYTALGQLPAGVDVACVVVGSGINGGRGAELAQELMARGVHVLQEHPLHHAELAACLREAHRHRVVYHLNTHYVHVRAVRRFIEAARRLVERQRPVFVDVVTSFQVLYTLFDVLGQALGTVRPWSFAASPPGAGVLRTLDGTIGGVPATLRVQNQLHPGDRDNGAHVLHRVTLGTEGGSLLLVTTHGPVLWSPRAHMPADYREAVRIEDSAAAHLDLPSVSCIGPEAAPSYRRVVSEEWPAATAAALLELRRAIVAGEDPRPRGQHHLALCRLTADATGRLGAPELLPVEEPHVLGVEALGGAAPDDDGLAAGTAAAIDAPWR
jgi:pyochelin biosynthetic protein PchG